MNGTQELSWWDRLKEAIVPESYGEKVVRDFLNTPANIPFDTTGVNYENFAQPNVYVAAKGAVSSAIEGFTNKWIFLLAGFVLLLVFVYAAAPALIRR